MNKEDQYREVYAQLQALLEGEKDDIARMANTCAVLRDTFHWWWVGFYRVMQQPATSEDELILGPFQGTVACMHIAWGRGVCGTAWKENKTQIVPNVHLFPGHIACSSLSQSEIVVPVRRNGKVVAVLDIDSEHLATFDTIDAQWLEKITLL